MRTGLSVTLAALVLSTSLAAHADPSNLPSPGDHEVGMGLAATGIVLTGAGGYFIYQSQKDKSSRTDGTLAIALTAGGLLTTATGLVLWLEKPVAPRKTPSKPRSALIVTPTSAWYRLEL